MSNQHVLKIHKAPLEALLSGAKTCEIRLNDRGFQVGDTVLLREIDPATEALTGRPDHARTITHIQQGYGLPDHLCVLSYAQPAAGEAVEIETPKFHHVAMACGLEDRGITDRYEAMEYGYNEALEQQWMIINSHGPLFAAPSAATPVAAGEPVEYWAFHNEFGELRIEDRWDVAKHLPFDLIPLITLITPPAAAHGDEAVQYRLLRVGEVIKATDEVLMDDCTTWHPMGDGPQIGIGWGWHAGLMPVRRIDAAMRAQGDGEVQ